MATVSTYGEFLSGKVLRLAPSGLAKAPTLNPQLFEFQRDIVEWALRKGRAAIFADCGMGKTPMQLEWAKHVPGRVLILAPLAVAQQTVREGEKFGIEVSYQHKPHNLIGESPKITITNYEMLDWFEPKDYAGVVLDESSILKSYDGTFRTRIIEAFRETPFRLACTATPAPNDFMELGNHAEFLGALTRTEMLSTFFVHDGGDTSQWRLKGHAAGDFWRWVCSWAVMIRKPSDLGYEDGDFILPPIQFHDTAVEATTADDGRLFAMPAVTLEERRHARSSSVKERVAKIYRLVTGADQWTENNALPTTGNGIWTIRNGSGSTERKQRKEGENGSVGDTPRILNTERKSSLSANPTPSSDNANTPDSNQSTELAQRNIKTYSPSKAEDALSAEQRREMREVISSTLTTATEATAYGDCSAQTATSELESSKTIASYWKGQQSISDKWLIWCDRNSEQDELERRFKGHCVSIRGSMSLEEKVGLEREWREASVPIMITKPKIFSFGLNWQHCSNVVFCGLSDSYEAFYQAVRRVYRFGQQRSVDCYIVTAENEGAVTENIKRKEKDAARMAEEMVKHMQDLNRQEIHEHSLRAGTEYQCDLAQGKGWTMHLGDVVEVIHKFARNSIHYSIFSPPFASLYTYSASERDMGNCRNHADFYAHFEFLTHELFRVMMPGRLLSFHCMNLPKSKERDGVIGISDFRGDLIRMFEAAGFIYHSEVCIWKDPVTAMQRTKALGLLHKQLKKDSCMSRQGIADYLVTMRKPGDNPERVTHTNESFPVQLWQRYASPVWDDINPSRTLNRDGAREEKDERHICPLQLDVIERAVRLWTNPGDLVLSPFAGIGSEGYVSLQEGRQFVGVELKKSYWQQAKLNLEAANYRTGGLFDGNGEVATDAELSGTSSEL